MSEPNIKPTPTAISQAAGVSVPYASQLLSGHRKPSLELAVALQEKLGIPVTFWPRPKTTVEERRRGQEQAA